MLTMKRIEILFVYVEPLRPARCPRLGPGCRAGLLPVCQRDSQPLSLLSCIQKFALQVCVTPTYQQAVCKLGGAQGSDDDGKRLGTEARLDRLVFSRAYIQRYRSAALRLVAEGAYENVFEGEV